MGSEKGGGADKKKKKCCSFNTKTYPAGTHWISDLTHYQKLLVSYITCFCAKVHVSKTKIL